MIDISTSRNFVILNEVCELSNTTKNEDEQGQDFYGNDSCRCRCINDWCMLDASDSWRHLVVEQVVLHIGDYPSVAFSLLVPAV